MANSSASSQAAATFRSPAFNLPQPVWLILLALIIGLADGLSAPSLIKAFGAGYGRALGDFALILIPSFVLAACLAERAISGAPALATSIAPITAAGMICPDTAYAALSSIARERKLSVAFGSHVGYRLLFPAGPLIVATGLGFDDSGLFGIGLALLVPTWLAGEFWARSRSKQNPIGAMSEQGATFALSTATMQALLPLGVLAGLLILGALIEDAGLPLLDFVTRPKGALLVAAAVAVIGTRADRRRACLDSAVQRSAGLLVVVGAASAFGLMLTRALPIETLVHNGSGDIAILLTLFAVTAVFKVTHGSATVTLATVTPVLAPLVLGAGVAPAAAVFAICLGSLVIVPTDSFYWLVRSDALANHGEKSAIAALGGGALLQATVGMATLLILHHLYLT